MHRSAAYQPKIDDTRIVVLFWRNQTLVTPTSGSPTREEEYTTEQNNSQVLGLVLGCDPVASDQNVA